MKSNPAKILILTCALWLAAIGTAWGYGGTIGPNEYVGVPPNRVATDYKNPLPVPGNPHHYHVTICNDGNWYGVWYPPEWKGNNGRVHATPMGKNQHGYAKEEDGTGGGVQIMGNGAGGNDITITFQKENGDTVFLTIHVINCSHHLAPGTPRGQVAAVAWVDGSRTATGLAIPGDHATVEASPVKAESATPQDDKAEGTRHLLLTESIPGLSNAATKFVPACSPTIYTTNVNCSMLVEDCGKVSPAEGKSMGACLKNKGDDSANIICQLNGKCPKAHLLDPKETRNDCPKGGRQWDVDVQWTFECVP